MVISQPIHSSSWAYERAKELVKNLITELTLIDDSIYDSLVNVVEENTK